MDDNAHVCPCIHAIHGRALAPAHTHKRAGNRAEKCYVTGVCLALLLSVPRNPRLFLEPSEMQQNNYSVHYQRLGGWM